VQAAFVEDLHGSLETHALHTADQLAGGHTHVVEDHVAGVGALLAHLVVALAQGQAGRVTFNDERADSGRATDRRVGACHHGENPGVGRVGDKALGAVDHVVVAIAHGGGFQRGSVGARIRLGEAERAEQRAAGQQRQVVFFLGVGAIQQDADGADAIVGAEVGTEGR